MKKIIIATLVFISATLSAQVVKSIENKQTELIINDTISLKKGGQIQVFKYIFQQVKILFSLNKRRFYIQNF
jgi:hypothetical protein